MGEPACGAARRIATEGRSCVSAEQRETLDTILRQSAFPAGSDVSEQRRQLRELTSAQPLPPDVTVTAAELGGVPTAEITVDGIEPRHVVLYFHGGVYAMGDVKAGPAKFWVTYTLPSSATTGLKAPSGNENTLWPVRTSIPISTNFSISHPANSPSKRGRRSF